MTTTRKRPNAAGRAGRATFSAELRDAIERSGLTTYALGARANVDPGIISRFMRAERNLTTATVDRLATALGLHLAATVRAKGRPRRAAAAPDEGLRGGSGSGAAQAIGLSAMIPESTSGDPPPSVK